MPLRGRYNRVEFKRIMTIGVFMRLRSAFPIALLATFSVLSTGASANDKKNDPEEIGNRDVGKGVNFYSLEKEIALGKQLAQ